MGRGLLWVDVHGRLRPRLLWRRILRQPVRRRLRDRLLRCWLLQRILSARLCADLLWFRLLRRLRPRLRFGLLSVRWRLLRCAPRLQRVWLVVFQLRFFVLELRIAMFRLRMRQRVGLFERLWRRVSGTGLQLPCGERSGA